MQVNTNMTYLLNVLGKLTRLYSTQTRKNHVKFISCSLVVSNLSPLNMIKGHFYSNMSFFQGKQNLGMVSFKNVGLFNRNISFLNALK